MRRAAAVTLLSLASATALASSHREAPGIANNPADDNTDVYAFITPGDPTHMTMIMNVWPAAQPVAGPNWYQFDQNAIYEMNVDYDGDGVEDVTYQFKFVTDNYKAAGGAILANFPSITFANGQYTNCSLCQTYTVTKLTGRRRRANAKTVLATNVPVAPNRIGPYTTDNGGAAVSAGSKLLADAPTMYNNYAALANNAIYNENGYKFFAGPRLDPFFVDLGGVFDRVAIRIPGITGTPKDSLATATVMSIAMEVPLSDFLATKGNNDSGHAQYFGVWASVSRWQFDYMQTGGRGELPFGAPVQVSRLGNPLVNELVIKINDKDKFNATEPVDDVANFASYVLNPQLATVLNLLYGTGGSTAPGFITNIQDTNRLDLVAAFVTGVPGVNRNPNLPQDTTYTGNKDAQGNISGEGDMIRVNTKFAIQEWPLSGRKLTDNVVKSALTFLAQCTKFTSVTGSPANPFGTVAPPAAAANPPVPANCVLDDFIDSKAKNTANTGVYPLATFPYEDLPYSAYGVQN